MSETQQRVLINIRVRPESKTRMEILAVKLDVTLSDIARLAMAKGLPILERELQ